MNDYVVFDLETSPSVEFVEAARADPWANGFKVQSGAKNPDVIAMQIEAWRDNLPGFSISGDPLVSRVVSWASKTEGSNAHCSTLDNIEDMEEAGLIEDFWGMLAEYDFIAGKNSRAFDIPFMLVRSAILGVHVPRRWDTPRYRTWPHADLQDLVLVGGKPVNAVRIAKGFGIETLEGGGGEVYGWVKAGRWDLVRSHNIGDVVTTRAILDRFLACGAIPAPGEREDAR